MPDGSTIQTASQGHRAGLDLTFSAPKSVSIQALIAGDQRLVEAHDRAVARTLEYGEGLAKFRVRVLAAPVSFEADDAQLLGQVADYYHATLKQAPDALAYLESRGLRGAAAMEAIDTFKLGYANRTLGLRLPEKTRKAGAEIRARLERLGVYRESGHEHLNGSVIVPLFDGAGQVVNLYGRKVTPNLRAGTAQHLYLPGARRGLFNRGVFAPGACEEVIVCEALIDALTFWCAGFRNVTSAYGIEGVTEELIEAIRAAGVARVLIAFDRDEAGERGSAKLAVQLQGLGIDCYRLLFPKGMDANEYALKVTPAGKSLGLLIRTAEWLGKGQAPQREVVATEGAPLYAAGAPLPSLAAEAGSIAAPVVGEEPADLPVRGAPLAAVPAPTPTLPASPLPPAVPASSLLPAAAVPSGPAVEVPTQVSEREVVLRFGEGGRTTTGSRGQVSAIAVPSRGQHGINAVVAQPLQADGRPELAEPEADPAEVLAGTPGPGEAADVLSYRHAVAGPSLAAVPAL
ncbi:MAG: relaxase domain-containing protein [Pseudomonadota bacterium]|nr:relaxase domain-containing protein [Pseudomonadota bacterium]